MAEKEISKKSYVWGHIGTILFHVLIASFLIALYFRDHIGSASRKTMVLILGSVLLIVSLLALAPILKDYDKIIIE